MGLCGSFRCGCGVTSTAATTGAIGGELPTIFVSGSGEAGDPYDLQLNDAWAAEVVDAISTDQTPVTYTGVTPATNFSATLNMRRLGAWGVLSVLIERTGGNIAASEAVVATIEASARGTFTGFTQALTLRATSSPTVLGTAIAFINANTGQISVNWLNTWTTGLTATWTGVVYLGL